MRKSKRFSMMWLITLSFFVFLILAGGCDEKKPDVKDPVDRPTITLVAPADLATDVPINRKIAVTFSEPMEPTTITSSTFTLKKGTTSVSGAVTYTGITATFSPTTDLDGGSEYTVTVTKGVKNLEGIAMAKNYVWSWTTDTYKDTTAPLVSSTVPANLAIDVPYNTKTRVTFSEPMDPLSITTSTFTLKIGNMPIIGSIIYSGLTATFTPAANLEPNTEYTATVTTGVEDLAGNPLEIEFVWTFTTSVLPDTTPPTVSSTFPKDKATDVPFNTKINALFSEAMDPTTLTTITFTVKKGSTSVPGTVTYTGFTATFAPTNNLAASTLFTATITTGAKDLAGNPLASNYVWSWTTDKLPDTTPPTVILTFPDKNAMDVPFNSKITATFSEAMDPSSITTVTFTLKKGGTPITGTVTYTGVTATFTPLSDLEALTVYTATVTTGVKDLAGNRMASNYVWSFTTDSLPDTTPPTVSSTDPVDLKTDVQINKIISASFSEAMDPTTITTVTFILENGSTPVAGSVDYAGSIATLTPSADLLASTQYTATITTGVKDLAGNPMESDYVWSFTTGTNVVAINPVILGSTSNFAVLAGSAVSTVPASDITGDVGLSPAAESYITGFSQTKYTGYSLSPQVTGFIYAADMASPTPANLTLAKGDLTIAYNDAASRGPTPTGEFLNPGAGNLAGLSVAPGLYKFTGSAIATANFTLTGGANDVWIFQISSNLQISNGVQIILDGGAKSANVFWQVGTNATLGTTVQFKGTILAEASITLGTGAMVDGRLLVFTGEVALDQNLITIPIP